VEVSLPASAIQSFRSDYSILISMSIEISGTARMSFQLFFWVTGEILLAPLTTG